MKGKYAQRPSDTFILLSCSEVEADTTDGKAHGMSCDGKLVFAEWRQATKADEDGNRPFEWMFPSSRELKYEKPAQVEPEVWIPKNREGGLSSLRVE